MRASRPPGDRGVDDLRDIHHGNALQLVGERIPSGVATAGGTSSNEDDPAHAFLRGLVVDAASALVERLRRN